MLSSDLHKCTVVCNCTLHTHIRAHRHTHNNKYALMDRNKDWGEVTVRGKTTVVNLVVPLKDISSMFSNFL